MPIASRMICPATTATTRMIVAYTVARSAVRRRSARVRDAVNPAKIATLPIGSIVVQIVAKSLLILMSKGDMVNEERVTPEVEREREKVTTLKRRRRDWGSRLEHLTFELVRPYLCVCISAAPAALDRYLTA